MPCSLSDCNRSDIHYHYEGYSGNEYIETWLAPSTTMMKLIGGTLSEQEEKAAPTSGAACSISTCPRTDAHWHYRLCYSGREAIYTTYNSPITGQIDFIGGMPIPEPHSCAEHGCRRPSTAPIRSVALYVIQHKFDSKLYWRSSMNGGGLRWSEKPTVWTRKGDAHSALRSMHTLFPQERANAALRFLRIDHLQWCPCPEGSKA